MLTRRVPLAWKNLTHDRRRLGVAMCGIGFAVLLMFTQTGFKNALFDSAVKLIADLDADIVLVGSAQYALPAQQSFPRERLYQARACPGVAAVYPLYVEPYRGIWQRPGHKAYSIRVLALEPGDPVLRNPELDKYWELLRLPNTAVIDRRSKSIYGVTGSLEEPRSQPEAELAGRGVRLVGSFAMGTDFAFDGNLLMSTANFARYFPGQAGEDPLEQVAIGVVHVEEGQDADAVARRIRAMLPGDVRTLTKSQLLARETRFWADSTPIGYVFLVGTVIGFVVGVIICYQIIHASITDHMAELATLKAMGYSNRYFIGFVLQEALFLSLLSFAPGLVVSWILYYGLARHTGLLMILNTQRAALVLGLTIAMCIASGCLAMRKVLAADPAELF